MGFPWDFTAGDDTPGGGLQIREPTEEGELSATGDWCLARSKRKKEQWIFFSPENSHEN